MPVAPPPPPPHVVPHQQCHVFTHGRTPIYTAISACAGATCHGPSSFRLTGRVAPAMAGSYGFNVTFDPPLPYPSPEAYARLWVHDHLLYPVLFPPSSFLSAPPPPSPPPPRLASPSLVF